MTSRANSDRDLHLDLRAMIEPGSRTAREQLITALREGIRSGRLGTDTRLPPSRALASDLGLARNTVAEA
ncbi:GntR family transcriptional regulator, partial [Mycolicibacterium septicum]